MIRTITSSLLALFVCVTLMPTMAHASTCAAPTAIEKPDLYPMGWIPWIGDLKSWRNYDPESIPGVGRLIHSPDGTMVGEPLAGSPTCNVLQPGEYVYVMKWQDNEVLANYIGNTDIIYLRQPIVLGPNYIRHSQLAAGFPVFCAGTFKVLDQWWPRKDELSLVNEVVEITNFSGHYKPKCKCLGLLADRFRDLNINTDNAEYKFMGVATDC